MKYYIYFYWNKNHAGRRNILAENEETASKRLRQFLNEHHPFMKYFVRLEQVLPA